MNKPRIVVRYFGGGRERMWDRFIEVLIRSARLHCANWELDLAIEQPTEEYSPAGLHSEVVNTQKLDIWHRAVQEASDGDRLLLLDADTLINKPIDDVWDQPFDVAYTVKPQESRYPLNAGVMFLRVSRHVRQFMAGWADWNRRMLHDKALHDCWKPIYGGINQSALGMILRQRRYPDVAKVKLPCERWNLDETLLSAFNPKRTRIIHYKGELRLALLAKRRREDDMVPVLSIWYDLERAPKKKRDVKPTDLSNTMITPADLETDEPSLTERHDQADEPEEEGGQPDARP